MELLIALCLGLFIYFLFILAFRNLGERFDTIRRRLGYIDNSVKSSLVLNEELNKPLSERFLKPILKSITDVINKPKNSSDENSKKIQQTNKLKKMLNQAGFAIGVAEYNVIRLMVIFGLAIFFAILVSILDASVSGILLGAMIGLFIGYAGMRFFLTNSITKRKKLMERQLPDVLDLLSVSVEAGLGFEQAINHITNNMEGPLIDELCVTYREMTMGRTRRDALLLFGERCDLDEIKSFVGALVQAAQLGISMKNVLRSQSAAMRQARKAKVQEKAMKVSVKMLIPMVAFIFPVIFIILLGPAVVNVIGIFSK